MPDDDYMTVAEFAALPAAAHHAVWAEVRRHGVTGRVATIPVSGILRYHRDQVLALLAEAGVRA